MKVKLEDIIEAMEFANMETEYYYDTHNEKVLMLFDGMVDGEDNPELFEDIKEGFVEDYIPLPGQYDINEYRIMEEFIYELPAGMLFVNSFEKYHKIVSFSTKMSVCA